MFSVGVYFDIYTVSKHYLCTMPNKLWLMDTVNKVSLLVKWIKLESCCSINGHGRPRTQSSKSEQLNIWKPVQTRPFIPMRRLNHLTMLSTLKQSTQRKSVAWIQINTSVIRLNTTAARPFMESTAFFPSVRAGWGYLSFTVILPEPYLWRQLKILTPLKSRTKPIKDRILTETDMISGQCSRSMRPLNRQEKALLQVMKAEKRDGSTMFVTQPSVSMIIIYASGLEK